MYFGKLISRLLTVSTLLIFLVSCVAGLTINPPGPDNQTLLVLPVKLTNKTMTAKQAFYYKYTIENAYNRSESFDVVIKLPVEGGMLVVGSLPPGSYVVSKFSYFPVGSGVSYSGNNVRSRNDRFKLESGKITIFSQTLHVLMENETVGRMGTTYFRFDLEPISSQREKEIMETLKTLPNIETWDYLMYRVINDS
ncbi:MAG: hypothetical protein GY802_29410 [Gammaproteobacteria bacterium]|nr:hypothetical protein [Gammaproteobacteria bacterium]